MFQKSKMYKNIGSFFFQHNLLSLKSLKGKKNSKTKLKINRHTMGSDGQSDQHTCCIFLVSSCKLSYQCQFIKSNSKLYILLQCEALGGRYILQVLFKKDPNN